MPLQTKIRDLSLSALRTAVHRDTIRVSGILTVIASQSSLFTDMSDSELNVKVTHRDQNIELAIANDANISDLAAKCAEHIGAPVEKVSLFIMPKPGFLKHPFSDRKLSDVLTPSTRIKLVGTPSNEVKKLEDMGARVQAREESRRNARITNAAKPSRNRDWKKVQEEAQFTFHAIEPLMYLPDPEKSRRFLQRLANDPGIKASMRKHKFSVGLLTEMNPAEHTTHESKTLGLNRNRGEVIELRLRTDRYDGYRDYKIIRKTLCHELSHNIWGDHDRNFWDLTKEIEQEVEKNDWQHGGSRLTEQEFYNPDDNDEGVHADHGGWNGGEFVLGRSGGVDGRSEEGLSRREIMARAAMARMEKQKRVDAEKNEEERGQQ